MWSARRPPFCETASIYPSIDQLSLHECGTASVLNSEPALGLPSRKLNGLPNARVGTARQSHFQAARACRFTSRSASWVSKTCDVEAVDTFSASGK
jgi:hypothetical protein